MRRLLGSATGPPPRLKLKGRTRNTSRQAALALGVADAKVIRIDALLDPCNVASRRVGENSGFNRKGSFGSTSSSTATVSTRSRTRCCDPISDGADRTELRASASRPRGARPTRPLVAKRRHEAPTDQPAAAHLHCRLRSRFAHMAASAAAPAEAAMSFGAALRWARGLRSLIDRVLRWRTSSAVDERGRR